VFEGLGKIDAAKFKTKFQTFDATNATTINTWIDNIQKEAELLTKSKDGKIYDFGYTFRKHATDGTNGNLKDDGNGYTARPVRTVISEFLTGLKLVNKKSFLDTLTDDISHSENVSIRLKGEPYDANKLKDDYGITLTNTQTLYKQGTTTKNYLVQGGVKG